MEQTKGYLRLRGEVYNLEKEAYENSSNRKQTVILKTSENNRVRTMIGQWKDTTFNVKMKCEGMDEPVEINEQEAIDEIKASFNEGDTVVVNCRLDVNTYKDGALDFYINSFYIADKKIDYSAKDFEETAELKTDVIITDKFKNGVQKVAFANYQGNLLYRNLVVKDQDVAEYLTENAEIGDVMNVFINVGYEPIFAEKSEEKSTEPARKTLKNRNIGGQSSRGKIIGNTEILEIIDIETSKTQKNKYSSEELGLNDNAPEDGDMPF